MAVDIRKIEGKPILIADYLEPFEGAADVDKTLTVLGEHHTDDMPIFIVISVSNKVVIEFSDMVVALQKATEGDLKAKLSAPNLKAITVTNNEMHRLGAEAFQQEQYGGIQMPIYETLDEALEAADQLIAEATK